MGKRRKKSDEFITIVSELIECFWQVGAVVTIILCIATGVLLDWAIGKNSVQSFEVSELGFAVLQNIGWVHYLFPLAAGLFALYFAGITYRSYLKERRI